MVLRYRHLVCDVLVCKGRVFSVGWKVFPFFSTFSMIYDLHIYIYICMCLFLYSSRSTLRPDARRCLFNFILQIVYFNLFFFSKLKIYSIPNFSAFLRPPKKPAQVFYCSHNFSISLRGLYIGLIY